MTCFRAALNLAYADGLVTSDFAWRRKLVPVKNADRRRELYLKRAQRKKFIEKASPDLGQFLRGLALVPLRPGALAALRVADYDPHLKVLKVGKDKNDPGFNTLDKNNDGYLSRVEAAGNPDLAKNFKQADKNGDGKLSRAEYLAVMTKKDAKTAKRKLENAGSGSSSTK
jgi:hypothetical protein